MGEIFIFYNHDSLVITFNEIRVKRPERSITALKCNFH